jgi:Pectate lyase superfamily protein
MTVPPDSYFTAFTFKTSPAGSGQAALTLPARLSSGIVNVKDWGAKGDGVTDDSSAIQAAINYGFSFPQTAPNNHGATVYIPPGTYRIGSQLLLFGTIIGAGRGVSILRGNYSTGTLSPIKQTVGGQGASGNVVDQPRYLCMSDGDNAFDLLADFTIWNESVVAGSGAYFDSGTPGINPEVRNMGFVGTVGLCMTMEQYGVGVYNCVADCTIPITTADDPSLRPTVNSTLFPNNSVGDVAGSVGFYVPQGATVGCRANGFDIGFVCSGAGGPSLHGNRAYRCWFGFNLGGIKPDKGDINPGLFGGAFHNNIADRCALGAFTQQSVGLSVVANVFCTAPVAALNPSAAITNMTWSSGTVTVATSSAHNIAGSTGIPLQLSVSPANWMPNANGYVSVNIIDGTHFSYSTSNPGSPSFSSGTWNYPPTGEIYTYSSSSQSFLANTALTPPNGDSVVINQGGGDSITYVAMRGVGGWLMPPLPSDPTSAACFSLINCGLGGNPNPPAPFLKFAGLPSAGPGQGTQPQGPFNGQEFTIIDAQKSTGGAATFGDIVIGGSSNHYKIRYDGTNWRRVG